MGNWYGISRLAIEFCDEDNTLADKRTLYNLGSTTYETEHLTPWIHPSSTSATPHKSQSFSIFAPANHVLFKKQTTSPHIKVLYVFIYGTSFKKFIMYTWCIHAACFVHWYP